MTLASVSFTLATDVFECARCGDQHPGHAANAVMGRARTATPSATARSPGPSTVRYVFLKAWFHRK